MLSLHAVLLTLAMVGQTETVLLQFTAPWCGPCQSMKPAISEMKNAGYKIKAVDLDQNPALARKYRVSSIPCFVMLKKGKEIGRVTGACSKMELARLYNSVSVGHQGTMIAQNSKSKSSPGIQMPASGSKRSPYYAPDTNQNRSTQPKTLFVSNTTRPRRDEVIQRTQFVPDGNQPVAQRGSNYEEVDSREPAQHDPRVRNINPDSLLNTPLAQALSSSVRLLVIDPNGSSRGSGTIVDAQEKEALILTCGHLFRDSQGKGRVIVDVFGPKGLKGLQAQVIGYDLDRDIGLVRVETPYKLTAAKVPLSANDVQKGSTVFSFGCPGGKGLSILQTNVTSINRYAGPENLQVAGEPLGGRSGGGLFSQDGRLIGVLNHADPKDKEGLYKSLATLQEVLDDAKLSFVYNKNQLIDRAPTRFASLPSPPKPNRLPPQAARVDNVSNPAAGQPAPIASANPYSGKRVVCVIESIDITTGEKSHVLIENPSAEFLQQVEKERRSKMAQEILDHGQDYKKFNGVRPVVPETRNGNRLPKY